MLEPRTVTEGAAAGNVDPWAVTVSLKVRSRRTGGRLATRLKPTAAVRDRLGFSKLMATEVDGRSIFRLTALDIGDYDITPTKDDVAITAPTGLSTELAAFDTDRDRVHGHLFVAANSVDDPASLPSLVLKALSYISLPGKLAGIPDPVTAVLSHSGQIVHTVRKVTRHESDYHLRVARLRAGLADGVVARILLPLPTRPLKPRPPDTSLRYRLSAAIPFEEFGKNLNTLASDVLDAAQAIKVSPDWARMPSSEKARAELLIEAGVRRMVVGALHEFTNRYPLPLATRQLRFEGGPEQFLMRVTLGQEP
jgi:hypothetical protein